MSAALLAAFRSRMLAELDRHHLEPVETVRAGFALALLGGAKVPLSRDELHDLLDVAIMSEAPGLAGALDALPAVRRVKGGGT